MERKEQQAAAQPHGRRPKFVRRASQGRHADSVRIWGLRSRLVGWIVFVCGTLLSTSGVVAETNQEMFRVGFSRSTFSEVNENDAMAAIKVWSETTAKERNISMDPDPRVYNNVQEIGQALAVKRIDSIALTADEYWKLRHLLDERTFIVGNNNGSVTEEYVLLVHKDSQIKRLEDLRGRSLTLFQNSRMSLASIWVDVVLLQAGFPPAAEFCRVTQNLKISNTVLPVFFRQADACVVTLSSFKTMSELNPQLGQRLKVLISSPELIPGGFSFRRGYNKAIRKIIITELIQTLSSPASEQIMMLFQLGALEARPISCLDSAFKLLTTHERLLDRTKPASNKPPLPLPKDTK